MSLITIEHLRKEFEGVTPLEDVNATVNEGDVISIIGPSGTGKSTLLRCLNCLEEPTSGKIIVDGEDICDPACNIALVRRTQEAAGSAGGRGRAQRYGVAQARRAGG